MSQDTKQSPKCCSCNKNGSSQNCLCVRSERRCLNCLPARYSCCENQVSHASTTSDNASSVAHSCSTFAGPDVVSSTANAAAPSAALVDSLVTTATASSRTSATPLTTVKRLDTEVRGMNNPSTTEDIVAEAVEEALVDGTNGHALPPLPQMSDLSSFHWAGNVDGLSFSHSIEAAYNEVVHWRRNLFMVPSGKVGKRFVSLLATLWQAYAEASALESVAFKAAMVMQALLLQKPSLGSKAKDHVACLERRLKAWDLGLVDDLVREGRVLQAHLQRVRSATQASLSTSFSRLMFQGKVRAAVRLLAKNSSGGVLDLDAVMPDGETVRENLKSKHPPGQPLHPAGLKTDSGDFRVDYHPVLFESLTGTAIRSAAVRTFGGAGPSGVDAAGWRRMCSTFHGASNDLCNAMAAVGRCL